MLPILSIDGAVIAIIQDVVEKSISDPDILRKFLEELKGHHDGIPRWRISIRALNSVYSTGIPDTDNVIFRQYIDEVLEHHVGERYQGTLILGMDTDVGFLDLLAQVGPNRVELLASRKYPSDRIENISR